MNSFRFLEQGIERGDRAPGRAARGGRDGRAGDAALRPASGRLSSLRSKEEAHDYRYFPEPDLVPLVPTEAMLERARAALPELPAGARRSASSASWGCPPTRPGCSPSGPSWATTSRRRWRRRTPRPSRSPTGCATSWSRVWGRRGSRRVAGDARARSPSSWRWCRGARSPHGAGKQVLDRLVAEGGDPARDRRARGARRDGRRRTSSRRSWRRRSPANPDAVERIRGGNAEGDRRASSAPVMRETKGRADGGEVTRLVRERLGV